MSCFPLVLMVLAQATGADVQVDGGERTLNAAGLDRIARETGVTFVAPTADVRVETAFGPITAKPAEDAADRFAGLLAKEFAVYPPDLVKRTRLRRVVLCAGLAFDGQLRGAIPDYGRLDLYLDVVRGDYNSFYQRTAIHHEFFHIIDECDDGNVYRDDAWSALNPPSFRYGAGGRDAQDDPKVMYLTDETPGFLTRYARSGVEEDKAEVFSRLITAPREVALRVETDVIVARKVARMKSLLKDFSPSVDDEFWRKVDARAQPPVTPSKSPETER